MRALPIIQAKTDYDRSLSRMGLTILFLDFKVGIARPVPVQKTSMHRTRLSDPRTSYKITLSAVYAASAGVVPRGLAPSGRGAPVLSRTRKCCRC